MKGQMKEALTLATKILSEREASERQISVCPHGLAP